jgi:cytochrome c oxidase subunit III
MTEVVPGPDRLERLGPYKVGMLTFLLSEVAFFSTLIVTYVWFLGKSTTGPTPAEALSLNLVIGTTLCLVASSVTIHFAEHSLRRGRVSTFLLLWVLTIGLGVLFLVGTGYEWYDLIYNKGLTISRNMFGTTFYTLVGFHAAHVTGGVIMMLILLGLALRGQVSPSNVLGVELVSWYWHFVDVVWLVVFTLVYVIGR